jgi:uncharacterized protein YjbI with pentapeptide repeats
MMLHGNNVTVIYWEYQTLLQQVPTWLRTLEKVVDANLGYCDVKEMKKGAFPASLRALVICAQRYASGGLRLHPDSFEGLPNLRAFEACGNQLTEDDMHPGLFAGATSLELIDLNDNGELRKFAASELFPGGSSSMRIIHLLDCGVSEGTDFQGLPNLEYLDLDQNDFTENDMQPGMFAGATSLETLYLEENPRLSKFAASELFPGGSTSLTFLDLSNCNLSEGTDFQGLPNLEWLNLYGVVHLPSRLFSGLCSLDLLWLSSESFNANTFAGTTLCGAIFSGAQNPQVTQYYQTICFNQADADSESKCECVREGTCKVGDP